MGRALTHRVDVAADHHECGGFQTLLALEGLVAGLVASKRVIDLLPSLRAAVLAIGDKFIAADMCGDVVKVITGIFSRHTHGRGYYFRSLVDADRTGAGCVAEEVAIRINSRASR